MIDFILGVVQVLGVFAFVFFVGVLVEVFIEGISR